MKPSILYETLSNFGNYWRRRKGRFLVISEKTFAEVSRKTAAGRRIRLIRLDKMTDVTTLGKLNLARLKKRNYKYILLDSDFNVAELLLRDDYEKALAWISGNDNDSAARLLFIVDGPTRLLISDFVKNKRFYDSAQMGRLASLSLANPDADNMSTLQKFGLSARKEEKLYPIAGIALRDEINFDKKYKLEFLCPPSLRRLVDPLLWNKTFRCYTIWNPDADKLKFVEHNSRYTAKVYPAGTSILSPVIICQVGPGGSTHFSFPDDVSWAPGLGKALDDFWEAGGAKKINNIRKLRADEDVIFRPRKHIIAVMPGEPDKYELTIYRNRIRFEGIEIRSFEPRKKGRTGWIRKKHVDLLAFLYEHQNTFYSITFLGGCISNHALPKSYYNVYETITDLQHALAKGLQKKYGCPDGLTEAQKILSNTSKSGCKLSLKKSGCPYPKQTQQGYKPSLKKITRPSTQQPHPGYYV